MPPSNSDSLRDELATALAGRTWWEAGVDGVGVIPTLEALTDDELKALLTCVEGEGLRRGFADYWWE